MEIDIVFAGIDWWGRPGYKVVGKNVYVGSVDKLFSNTTKEEVDAYFKEHLDELVIFGTTFNEDDDPLGTRIKKDIKINII